MSTSVALLTPDDIEYLIGAVPTEDTYIPVDDARRAATSGGAFNVLHLRSGGKVDAFVGRASDEFTRSRLARRVRAEVLGELVWVATPEDVVLAKLRWRLESRSEVQWRDCVEIAYSNELDREYLDRWA